jgi:hypothetical protein
VISYTRRGLDSPARLYRLWRSFSKGTVLQGANRAGRALEDEKREEIRFILPYVLENLAALAPGTNRDALYLAGWGAGGSALVYLAAEPPARWSGNPAPAFGAKGLVAVESRLWSVWEAAPPPDPVDAGPNPALKVLGALRNWFAAFLPEKMAGPGAPPRPLIPVVYLVSDRAWDAQDETYAALFSSLDDAVEPAALAALVGAGPLDYSSFPVEYPFYTLLFPGQGEGAAPRVSSDAAALIARFCELVADKAGASGTPTVPTAPAAPTAGRTELQLETRYWNFGDLRVY